MAPRPPWSRQAIAQALQQPSPSLPLLLGSPHLHGGAGITLEKGVYRLRRLVLDEAGLAAFQKKQQASGGSFFPEHVDQFQRPTGEILAEGRDLSAFLKALDAVPWESNW